MQKRIRQVGFSAGDIGDAHRLAIWGGFVAILVGCAVGAGGGFVAITNADWAAAARVAQAASSDMANSASNSPTGTPSELSARIKQIHLASAMLDAPRFALPLPGLNVQTDVDALKGAMGAILAALGPFERPTEIASQVRKQLQLNASQLARITTKLEPYRSSASGSSAFESASRLQGYLASGFGVEAAARVNYDIANLYYQIRTNEAGLGAGGRDARQAAETIYQAVYGLSTELKSNAIATADATRLMEAAQSLAAASSSMAGAASAAQSKAYLYAAFGIALAVAGAMASLFGLVLAAAEFGSRFRKSTAMFTRGEAALVQLAVDANAIAEGKLNTEPSTADESTVATAEALAQIARNIRQLMQRSSQFATTIATGAAGLLDLGSKQAAQMKDQSDGMSSTGESLSECVANVEWIHHDARSMGFAAERSASAFNSSTRAIQESIDRLDSIRATVQETSKRIKRLGEGSQTVAATIDDLSAISEQANVLAMNAALEAERAGAAGAGFRLVASEIKALSARLQTSLQRASESVDLIQADARVATESMEKSAQKVAAGAFIGEVAAATLSTARFCMDSVSHASNALSTIAEHEADALSQAVVAVQSAAHEIGVMAQGSSELASKADSMSQASALVLKSINA